MIVVSYTKNSISISGHAKQAPKGKDIVCAAVSAIFFGAITWFKEKDINLKCNQQTNAMKIELINKSKTNQHYIELIVKQLKPITYDYKKYIKLNKGR